MPVSTFAVPAYTGPRQVTQADGTQITLHGFGDEFLNGFKTIDGNVVAFDRKSRTWYYAEISPDGWIVPGTNTVGQPSMMRSARLTQSDLHELRMEAYREASYFMDMGFAPHMTERGISPFDAPTLHMAPIRPTNNEQPLLLLLIEYNDVRFTENYATNFFNLNHYWAEKIFGTNASFGAPTVNDYFREVSGSFNLHFTRPAFPYFHDFPLNEDGSVDPLIDGVHSVLVRHGVARVRLD